MKRHIFRFLEAILFVLLLAAMLFGLTHVMERKASIVRFQPFFDKADEYDVLLIGDSHMVNAVFPMELWEKHGIAAYNISSYGNTLPVSYWALVNALDYASPKLVVMDVKDVNRNLKVTGSSSDVHTAFDCYPLSRNKIRAIEDLMDDPGAMDDVGNRYVDMKWEYYFTLGKYHSRWNELGKSDWVIEPTRQSGSDMAIGVAVPDDYDIIDSDRALDEYGWGFEYLRRMIEMCQERNIDVLLTHLPYPCDMEDQMAANTVSGIAEEYGVAFIDFVNLDQVVDYTTDCYDADSHLNPSGARKVSDYLGRYIVDHYPIEDRRCDQAYAHWQRDAQAYAAHKRGQLGEQQLETLLMMLHDEQFNVQMAIRPKAELYWNDQLLTLIHNIAREHVFEEDAYSKWSNSMFPLEGLDASAWADEAYYLEIDRDHEMLREYTGAEAERMQKEVFGSWGEGDEIEILVTDRITGDQVVRRRF